MSQPSKGFLTLRCSAAGLLAFSMLQLPCFTSFSFAMRLLLGLLATYVSSVLDGAERRPSSRRSAALLAAVQGFWNQVLPRLFDVRCHLEAAEDLRKCEQCIVAVHPHGVLSLGHYLVISGFDAEFDKSAPAARRCALSAGVLFKLPFVRELALGLGCVDAHRDVAKRCLSQGFSLSVVPGGEREQLLAQRGSMEQLVLKTRQGFVRLALQHGVPLVPVYAFGEAQLFRQSQLLMSFRAWVQRRIGVALVMPYGPSGLPWQTFSTPVRIVVGRPLSMPKILEPSKAEIDEHHARYVHELSALFERNKVNAGYPSSHLHIV